MINLTLLQGLIDEVCNHVQANIELSTIGGELYLSAYHFDIQARKVTYLFDGCPLGVPVNALTQNMIVSAIDKLKKLRGADDVQ